ncbi:hypothetical protein Q2941_25835 [Bradyrhizobium sp. UFLA05-153]
MIVKVHQGTTGVLQHANELLRAHQVVIDAWYEAWAKEQRSKAVELLRKRHRDLSARQLEAE